MIRRAFRQESAALTKISRAAKKYWQYPIEFFDIWKDELTISDLYLEQNEVYVYDTEEGLLGYYSLVELSSALHVNKTKLDAGLWLDHMFVIPEKMGSGIGVELFNHCISICSEKTFSSLRILADPNASGFYHKMGCQYIKEVPSSIPDRTTPYFEFHIKQNLPKNKDFVVK